MDWLRSCSNGYTQNCIWPKKKNIGQLWLSKDQRTRFLHMLSNDVNILNIVRYVIRIHCQIFLTEDMLYLSTYGITVLVLFWVRIYIFPPSDMCKTLIVDLQIVVQVIALAMLLILVLSVTLASSVTPELFSRYVCILEILKFLFPHYFAPWVSVKGNLVGMFFICFDLFLLLYNITLYNKPSTNCLSITVKIHTSR